MLARQSPARMLRGGMMIPGVDPGPKWIDDTVHFFFQPAGAKSGIDLMSINIQPWILKLLDDTDTWSLMQCYQIVGLISNPF